MDVQAKKVDTYTPVIDWLKLPPGYELGDVAAVGVDSADRVYMFDRGEHPVLVFDTDGNFLRSWGEGLFKRPHGLHVAPDDTLWLTDDGDHSVRHCTADGKLLLKIALPDRPSPYMSGLPFNRCTHTALAPNGDIYVSDGYGNARIHKYASDGRLLLSWGAPGTDPGEFNIPHNITCDDAGWVYVADRENHRIQVFDGNGRYETQWNNLHKPCAIFTARGRCPLCYVAEAGPTLAVNRNVPNVGPRVTILDHKGQRVGRFGGPHAGTAVGEFVAPHGITVDSNGAIYVSEVAGVSWASHFPDRPPPQPLRRISKFARQASEAAPPR